jgi:hypothetical protein
MERIKRFFSDDSASAELTSAMLLVGAVLIVGAVGVGLYYTSLNDFFTGAKGSVDAATGQLPTGAPWTPAN